MDVLSARSVAADLRRFLRASPHEMRTHARFVAAIAWVVVIVTVGAGSTNTSIFGPLKWTDFVHVYSLGTAARTNQPEVLYDAERLHDLQASLVPESASDRFLTPYSPQTRSEDAHVRTRSRGLSQVIQMRGRQRATSQGTLRRRYPATHWGSTSSGGYHASSSCGRYWALYAMDGQPATQYPRE